MCCVGVLLVCFVGMLCWRVVLVCRWVAVAVLLCCCVVVALFVCVFVCVRVRVCVVVRWCAALLL